MKYLGQMKNQSKELSGGPFEHFHSRFKAPIFHFKAALLIHREEFGYTFWSVRLISSCKICSNTFSFQNTAAVCPVAPRWCQNIMPEKFQTCTKRIGRIVAPRTSSHINYGVTWMWSIRGLFKGIHCPIDYRPTASMCSIYSFHVLSSQ